MIWLTPQTPGQWYVMVTCDRCKSRTALFPDDTQGKGEFRLNYFFSCPNCNHQRNHLAERYWHPVGELAEVVS